MFSKSDIKAHIPTIINAYSKLFGEEYREIISERVNNLKYFIYYDSDSLENYYDFLLDCKQKDTNQLDSLRSLISQEIEIEEKIYKSKEQEALHFISLILPLKIKLQMFKNKLTVSDLFSNCSLLEEKSDIEYFSQADNEALKDSNTNINIKEEIKHFRMQYFSSLGFDIHLDLDSYDELIKRPDIKKLIPSEELIEKIINIKSQKLEQAEKEYYTSKYDSELYPISPKDVYNTIKNNELCVTSSLTFDSDKLDSVLFFTLRLGEEGMLDYLLLHEIYHIIVSLIRDRKIFNGFDITENNKCNPYNNQKRKYEILDENLADIYSIAVLQYLRKKDIYMLEEKNILKDISDIKFHNTSVITKKLLYPLVSNYHKLLARSLILGDRASLFEQIGENNFEDLNDAINYLDFLLCRNNIRTLREINLEDTDNPDMLEIDNQMKRIDQIYKNMDNYRDDLENDQK